MKEKLPKAPFTEDNLPNAKFIEDDPSDTKPAKDDTPDPPRWTDWSILAIGIFFIVMQWRTLLLICDSGAKSGFGTFLSTVFILAAMSRTVKENWRSHFHTLTYLSYGFMCLYHGYYYR